MPNGSVISGYNSLTDRRSLLKVDPKTEGPRFQATKILLGSSHHFGHADIGWSLAELSASKLSSAAFVGLAGTLLVIVVGTYWLPVITSFRIGPASFEKVVEITTLGIPPLSTELPVRRLDILLTPPRTRPTQRVRHGKSEPDRV